MDSIIFIRKYESYYGQLTSANIELIISDHTNLKVIDIHYTAQMDVINKSEKLSIFCDAEERVN